MKRSLLLFLCAVICLAGCSRGKIIPKKTFKKIYAEIFIADQIISEEYNNSKRFLDTTLVYESILEKYGYSAKDYQTSIENYMSDPILFTRVIKASGRIIDAKLKTATVELEEYEAELQKQRALENKLEAIHLYAPEHYYFLVGLSDTSKVFAICDSIKVYVDSTGCGVWNFDPQKGRDTIFRGPMIIVDTLAFAVDSLAVADTLAVKDAGDATEAAKAKPGYASFASPAAPEPAKPAATETTKPVATEPAKPAAPESKQPTEQKNAKRGGRFQQSTPEN